MNAHLSPPPRAENDIETLNVSEDWKRYFRAVKQYGGIDLPLLKALPAAEQQALKPQARPPVVSMVLAFFFGFFYYLAQGMWKKGLVLAGIAIAIIAVFFVISLIIGFNLGPLAASLMFAQMAPRDFYQFKVLGDDGWLPVKPGSWMWLR